MKAPLAVLYDANVLYPNFLRDFLIRLARTGAVRARWTEAIHEEWMRNLLANRPDLSREKLLALKELMNAAVPDCLVSGYEHRIESLNLPDPDDRHVLAAAIEANVSVIVTFNQQDFPSEALELHGLRAEPPGSFTAAIYGRTPHLVVAAARNRRVALRRPRFSVSEYLNRLRRSGLGDLADRLEADAVSLE